MQEENTMPIRTRLGRGFLVGGSTPNRPICGLAASPNLIELARNSLGIDNVDEKERYSSQ